MSKSFWIRNVLLSNWIGFTITSVATSGTVDLQLRPASQSVCVNEIVEVALHAISADGVSDSLAGLDVALDWNPVHLRLLGTFDDAASPYSWLASSFPDDRGLDRRNNDRSATSFWSEQICTVDGQCSAASPGCDSGIPCDDHSQCRSDSVCDTALNCPPFDGCCVPSFCFFTGFPFNDGTALYEALSQVPGPPAVATPAPDGLLVMKFRFRVLTAATSQVRIVAGGPGTPTAVYDSANPGVNILGNILTPPPTITVDVSMPGTCCNGTTCVGDGLSEACCLQAHPGANFISGKQCSDPLPCAPGCGPCRLWTDLEPFFCVIDLGEVLKALESYSEPLPCSTTTAVGMTPGALIFDAGCPQACSIDAECVSAVGAGQCVNGLCCDLSDLSELVEILDMFTEPTTPRCAHPCTYGACERPAPDNCCRDRDHFTGNFNLGTTESDCFDLGGVYLGDDSDCSISALPLCPGAAP